MGTWGFTLVKTPTNRSPRGSASSSASALLCPVATRRTRLAPRLSTSSASFFLLAPAPKTILPLMGIHLPCFRFCSLYQADLAVFGLDVLEDKSQALGRCPQLLLEDLLHLFHEGAFAPHV